jgi:hypothetical protein
VKTRILGVLGVLGGVLATGWLGLRVKPRPFPGYPESTADLDTVALPDGLPEPVTRFFKRIVGERVPIITSAVITGSVRLRFFGLNIPGRFRITHIAGQAYRHYIEATFFGLPIIKVNEWYLDGKARLQLPFGVVENEAKIDMAANLGLWAESIWLPSVFLTDSRVRWETIDEATARLVVPFGEQEDSFTVGFNPHTGLIRTLETMRFQEATDEAKTLWRNEALGWQTFNEITIPSRASVTWGDDGVPWSVWTVEDVAYNVDVSAYVTASGV